MTPIHPQAIALPDNLFDLGDNPSVQPVIFIVAAVEQVWRPSRAAFAAAIDDIGLNSIRSGGDRRICATLISVSKMGRPRIRVSWESIEDAIETADTEDGPASLEPAIQLALHELDLFKKNLRKRAINYYRPLLVIFLSGTPSDYDQAVLKWQTAETQNELRAHPMALDSEGRFKFADARINELTNKK